jgi:hypothetical protein
VLTEIRKKIVTVNLSNLLAILWIHLWTSVKIKHGSLLNFSSEFIEALQEMKHAATFPNEYSMKHKGYICRNAVSYMQCDKKSAAAINKHQCSEKGINVKKYFKTYLRPIFSV